VPRSERCRIQGNCADAIPGHARGQAPAAGGAPGAARTAPASGGSSGPREPSNGLEPFRRPLVGLGSSPCRRGSEDLGQGHGRGKQAVERQGRSRKTIGGRPASKRSPWPMCDFDPHPILIAGLQPLQPNNETRRIPTLGVLSVHRAPRRPNCFRGLRARACWDSGFPYSPRRDSSFGWIDSF
jgi:hypothetical protein